MKLVRSVPLAVLAVLAACKGSGSDVGPSFVDLPAASCRVSVRDDAGRAVAGARVSVGTATAVTGKSGRGDLFAAPRGNQLVEVDAAAASASATDRLASLAVALDVPGPDLPSTIYLPDTDGSAELVVATGAATGAVTLDDSGRTGARLQLGAGTVVADGAAASVTLRIGELDRTHLPAPLPSAPSGAWFATRGFWIDPPTATFAPGATLQVPDELQAAGLGCSLYHLDPATGLWTPAAGTASTGGGTIQLANAVHEGGLYVYVFDAPVATVRGRLVDRDARAVPAAHVRVDSAVTTTDSGGRFEAQVAGDDASANARTVEVEALGGPLWFAARTTTTTAAIGGGGNVDLGDLVLDTIPVTDFRIQAIRRGRSETGRRVTASTARHAVATSGYTDSQGQCRLEDAASGYFSWFAAFPFDRNEVFYAQSLLFVPEGRRRQDAYSFYDDRGWFVGGRSTQTWVVDSIGIGAVEGAAVVRGRTAREGFVADTPQTGRVFVGRDFGGRATATLRSESAGLATVSAFTIEQPNGDHLEMPVVRRQLVLDGAYDRHGLIEGEFTGFQPTSTRQLYASRPLEFDEWFDQRFAGAEPSGVVPTRVGGVLPAGRFRAGIALPAGHVAVAEGTVAGGVFTLTGAGVRLDVVVPEGTIEPLDLPIDRPANTVFTATGALTDLDGTFTAADLRFDLALEQPSGRIAEIARDVGGNLTANGADASFLLPALTGPLAGHAWLVALSVRASTATTATSQRSLLRFTASAATSVPFTPLPTLTGPLDGATVPATGFQVDFALPTDAMYATIELRSDGAEQRLWTVLVPPTDTQFEFVELPTQAESPLEAGRTYTMTLTTYRADAGFLFDRAEFYRDLVTYWVTIGAAERGVRASSSRTVTITAN